MGMFLEDLSTRCTHLIAPLSHHTVGQSNTPSQETSCQWSKRPTEVEADTVFYSGHLERPFWLSSLTCIVLSPSRTRMLRLPQPLRIYKFRKTCLQENVTN